MVIETENMPDREIKINLMQGGTTKVLADVDDAIKVIANGKSKAEVMFTATVGEFAKDTSIINADEYKNTAIVQIKIGSDNEEENKAYNEALAKANNTTQMFLAVDAEPEDQEWYEVWYEEVVDNRPNAWYNGEGNWFELKRKQCNCGEKEFDKKFQCTRYGSAFGPVYFGNEKLADYKYWNDLIKRNLVTKEEKEILVGMSENEGKLDSIQSYDSEILTVGAMQKTVNPKGKGEFPIQVQEFKVKNPTKYKELFEDCGWTVEEGIMYYKDPSDPKSKKITGKELKKKIREGFVSSEFKKKLKCKPLEPIARASKDKDFQAKQVEDFINRLKNKVLPIKPTGYNYRLKDYLKSKLGKATVLDHHVNRPKHMKVYFGEALNKFYKNKDEEVDILNKKEKDKNKHKLKISRNPSDWGDKHSDYEKEILDIYGPLRGEALGSIKKKKAMTNAMKRYNDLKTKL